MCPFRGTTSLTSMAQGYWPGEALPIATPHAVSEISHPHYPGWHLWNLGVPR